MSPPRPDRPGGFCSAPTQAPRAAPAVPLPLLALNCACAQGMGARVFTCARSADDLSACLAEWATRGHDVCGMVADCAKAADREALVRGASEAFGGHLDVLVNNVGTNVRKPTARRPVRACATATVPAPPPPRPCHRHRTRATALKAEDFCRGSLSTLRPSPTF